MRMFAQIFVLFPLVACTTEVSQVSQSAPSGVIFSSQGLEVKGTDGLEISFGRDMEGVIDAVARATNARHSGPAANFECGGGPVTSVQFSNGLKLNFTYGAFEGWVATKAAAGATKFGLNVGDSGLSTAGSRKEQTSLGEEFETFGIHGLIDDSGDIAAMWAGTTCFFR